MRYGTSNFQVRFCLRLDESVTYPGFCLGDVRVDAYTPRSAALPCDAPGGSLVEGNVYVANTETGLIWAVVSSDEQVVLTLATAGDADVDDGFFTLYAAAGPQTLTATLGAGYGPDVQTPTVVLGDAVRPGSGLLAGHLRGYGGHGPDRQPALHPVQCGWAGNRL